MESTRTFVELSHCKTSPEFFTDQNTFLPVFSETFSLYLIMPFFINCNPDVRSLDKNVVEQELEFAINLALYGVLCSLGSQYIDGNDS